MTGLGQPRFTRRSGGAVDTRGVEEHQHIIGAGARDAEVHDRGRALDALAQNLHAFLRGSRSRNTLPQCPQSQSLGIDADARRLTCRRREPGGQSDQLGAGPQTLL